MRNHKVGRKNINVYTVYEYTGVNQDGIINSLKRKGFIIYDCKKLSKKRMTFKIKYCDNENFFAFINNMCYTNIKRVKDVGKDYFLLFLSRRIGLVVGGILFMIASVIYSDIILVTEFSGSGIAYKREVEDFLNEKGIKTYSRFSKIDMPVLSDEVLANNCHLTFVSCEKRGNRLIIELIAKEKEKDILTGKAKWLKATESGIITSIKVYRGTALLSVGDKVNSGDVIVDGYAFVKDVRVDLNVIASAEIKSEVFFDYQSEYDGDEENAVIFAENSLKDKEITDVEVIKTETDGKYNYKVKISYLTFVFVG